MSDEYPTITEDLVDQHSPWMTPDLQTYLTAIGGMFAGVEVYIQESDDGDQWSVLLDVDRCPPQALPYLAQWVGERLPVGLPEDNSREWIKDNPNGARGTVDSIVAAAQRSLTQMRHVGIIERFGNADTVYVLTYTSETPNQAQVIADVTEVMPADLVLVYDNDTGWTWGLVPGVHATWAQVVANHPTWADFEQMQTGATIFDRPELGYNLILNPSFQTDTAGYTTTVSYFLDRGGVLTRVGPGDGKVVTAAVRQGVQYQVGVLNAGRYRLTVEGHGEVGGEQIEVFAGPTNAAASVTPVTLAGTTLHEGTAEFATDGTATVFAGVRAAAGAPTFHLAFLSVTWIP